MAITASDPIVIQRCVGTVDLRHDSYVKESLDSKGRTIKIEIFASGHYFQYAFVPPIIKFQYTDSTITEILCGKYGRPIHHTEALDYNKTVYLLRSGHIIREYRYLNQHSLNHGELGRSEDQRPLVEYLYYAGCQGDSAYFLERQFRNNKAAYLPGH